MKQSLPRLLMALMVVVLSACTGMASARHVATPAGPAKQATATPAAQRKATARPTEPAAAAVAITLGERITINGSGAAVSGSTVHITAGGTYRISGALANGQVRVDTKEQVRLLLDGASITSDSGPALFIVDAKKVTLTLLAGTTSSLADSAHDGESDAALFTNDTLVIDGEGTLVVTGNSVEGICSDDDIIIEGGTIRVTAVDDGLNAHDDVTINGGHLHVTSGGDGIDSNGTVNITGGTVTLESTRNGIRAREHIAIVDGKVTVQAGGDGVKSGDSEDPEKGSVAIAGGTLDITAGEDGVQAQTGILIGGGDVSIASGGGSANSSSKIGSRGNTWGNWGRPGTAPSDSTSPSAKAIKAARDITITAGTIRVDSSDDALHSNDSLTISGGSIVLASGDDGIHADSTIEVNGGDISITRCYEGIESAVITINDGSIHLVASDDGINVRGGNDGSAQGGRPGQNTFRSSGNNYLRVNGGYVAIDALGDGIDVNGSIEMSGGVVIVHGPTENFSGALDYYGTFRISGGFLVAAGSAGMAQGPSTSSTQYALMHTFPSPQPAGTLVHVAGRDGQAILTFVPAKAYQSLVLCSPELKKGATYTIYAGGRSTGALADGLYSGGKYTAGTQVASFTVSSIVTMTGTYGGRFAPGPGGRR